MLDDEQDPGAVSIWLGAIEPILNATKIVNAVSPYAQVSADLLTTLQTDRAEEGFRALRPFATPMAMRSGPTELLSDGPWRHPHNPATEYLRARVYRVHDAAVTVIIDEQPDDASITTAVEDILAQLDLDWPTDYVELIVHRRDDKASNDYFHAARISPIETILWQHVPSADMIERFGPEVLLAPQVANPEIKIQEAANIPHE